MAVNIGPKIGIDGEAEYRKQINNIIQQAKTLDSEMRAVTSAFTKETTAKEKSAATAKILSEQVEVQKRRVEALTKMLERSQKELGENDDRTLKWKEAVNDATAQLNKMERSLRDSAEEVDDMGDALEQSEKHAFSFGDALKANVIGEAITSGIRALADSLVNMASAAKEAFVDTVQWADDLATLSTQTGLSTDALQEFEYMADLMDTDVDTITGSMAKLIKNMTTARKGTGDAADAFKALGVNITNADGSLRDNQEVFYETVDALGALTNETQRDAYAMSIFGKSAQDLNPLISAGADGMAAFAQEARDTGYVLEEDALNSLLGVSDAFARLENEAQGLKRRLSAELAPTIDGFVSDQLPQIMDDVEDIAVNLLPVLIGVLENLSPVISMIARDILPVVGDLLKEIMPLLGELISAAMPIITEILNVIVPILSELIGSILPVIIRLLQAILPAISSILRILSPILDLVMEIISPLLEIIGECLVPILSLLSPLIDLLGSLLLPILEELGPLLEIAFWPLKNIVLPAIQAVVEALKVLIGWIRDAVEWLGQLLGLTSKTPKTISFNKIGETTYSTRGADAAAYSARSVMTLSDSEAAAADAAVSTVSGAAAASRVRVGRSFAAETTAANSNVTNYGGVTINVQAAQGQDVNAIADTVMQKMETAVRRKEAVYA